MEKSSLPIPASYYPPAPAARQNGALRAGLLAFLTFILCFGWFPHLIPSFTGRQGATHDVNASKSACEQTPALFPADADDNLNAAFDELFTEKWQNASVLRLQGAVQVRTESFDDLGPIGDDKRWDVFYGFHEYLAKTFPKIHEELRVEKINEHGLIYTWQGSDETKKPSVLMAHQDTVPVDPDTIDSWKYPPWSGHFDGVSIWGRGASDCKNQLIGIMEAVEALLEAGFKPKRTIVMSYGFDEECSGHQGAGHLAPFLLERYGKDGVSALVDEGSGYQQAYGRGFAMPGVAEKGATDVNIAVRIPGGHSSIPPDHTGIGILSEIITAIEAEQYPTYLADENPYLGLLQCSAEYAPDFPKSLRKLLHKRSQPGMMTCKHGDRLAQEVAKEGKPVRYLMQTSQATDLIKGGTKLNALPENAVALVNHRINIGDEPETVWDHLTEVAKPIAKKYNLTLHAFDGTEAGYNSISLSHTSTTLRPAPVTPTGIDGITAYSVLSGTIRALFGEDTIVAPGLMTGNTDTRFYWDLTRNIFRFAPGSIKDLYDHVSGNIHTVNERVSVESHFNTVRWFTLWIRNMDEADLE